VFAAITTLPPSPAVSGNPSVSQKAICEAVKKSDRPVRTAITALLDEERIIVAGTATRNKKLYAISPAKSET